MAVAVWRVLNSWGESISRLVWCRCGLFGPSIHLNIADARICFGGHGRRSNNMRCIDDQNDSIVALSCLEAARLIVLSGPASRGRCPNSRLVY